MTDQQEKIIWTPAQLRAALNAHFNIEELHTLCYDVGIEYENWQNQTKPTTILYLLKEAERANKFPNILDWCCRQRSNSIWAHEIQIEPYNSTPPLESEATAISETDSEDGSSVHAFFFGSQLTLIVSAIIAVALTVVLFGVTTQVSGTGQVPSVSPSTIVPLQLTPTLSMPTTSLPLTPTPIVLPEHNLFATEIYEDPPPRSAFTMVIPKGWSRYSIEQPLEAEGVVNFSPKLFPNIYWRMAVEVSPNLFSENTPIENLEQYAQEYIGNAYSEFPDLKINGVQSDTARPSSAIYWSFTIRKPNMPDISMRALTEVRLQNKAMTVFTIYVPHDQFEERAIQMLRDSITLAPELKDP